MKLFTVDTSTEMPFQRFTLVQLLACIKPRYVKQLFVRCDIAGSAAAAVLQSVHNVHIITVFINSLTNTRPQSVRRKCRDFLLGSYISVVANQEFFLVSDLRCNLEAWKGQSVVISLAE